MSKAVYELIVGLVTVVEGAIATLCVYFSTTGKLDAKTASAITDSSVIVGGAVIGVCANFINKDLTKKK